MSLPGQLVDTPNGRVFVHTRPRASGAPTDGDTPLLLLHGFLLSHWSFAAVAPRLAADRPLILVDLPGSGESDRPPPADFAYDLPALAGAVLAVLDALRVPRVAIVGHGLGGAVALELAATHPPRCERLLLCGVAPSLDLPPRGLFEQLALLPLRGAARRDGLLMNGAPLRSGLSRFELAALLRRFVYKDPSLVTPQRVDYYWERLCRAGSLDALLHSLRAVSAPELLPGLFARTTAPALLVWGDEDRAAPLWRARRLQEARPGAPLAVIPASGHTPFEERPAEFCRTALPFLRGEPPPGEGLLTAPRAPTGPA